MSTLDIEIAVYHPQTDGYPEQVLFIDQVSDRFIAPNVTVEIPTGGSPVGDKRPLMLALRRVRGDTTEIRYSVFTVTFSKEGSVADSSNIFSVVADVDTYIGGDNEWHGMYLGHQEAMELSRVHVTWGGTPIPTPSI